MNYSETINLPDTAFSMKAGLTENEPERLRKWRENNLYERILENREDAETFILHDGPPYANGDIHIGHALNKILKDILVKFKTMQGFRAPYRPGWDCHGLPIEHTVTNDNPELVREGQMAVREACREFSLQYVDIQRDQFKRLGILGEWDNPYLTLNPEYEAEILRCFRDLNQRGYIYRQLKPVHWCWDCETALAEAEVEYRELTSPAVYVDFPVIDDPGNVLVSDDAHVMIWTTTPWTLPANVAIAVHPDLTYVEFRDPEGRVHVMAERLLAVTLDRRDWSTSDVEILGEHRGSELEDVVCAHPFVDDRASRVVVGELVTLEQGTGAVHIAPGHGKEDYEIGLEYDLPILSPVNDQGRFTDEFPREQGEHVLDADDHLVELLEDRGLLFYQEDVDHSYPFCWRCKKPVIFRATPQWFMDVDHRDLRERILEEIPEVRWVPDRGEERFRSMIEERPDWCLSRQRAWGVPIPALSCRSCGEAILDNDLINNLAADVREQGVNVWFERPVEEFLPAGFQCPECGHDEFEKQEDILDVWFDSGVSHQAVLQKDPNLEWPADVYLEGSDQHRGWFQLSMIPSMGLEDAPPFREIVTHGFVVDENGIKMSKSQGNVISPQQIVKEDGAEIVRLWVATENYQEDLALSSSLLEQVKTRYRRIRNTFKFFLGNLQDMEGFDPESDALDPDHMTDIDRWFLNELFGLIRRVSRAYEARDFHRALNEIHNFCAVEASSLYLDVVKDRLYCEPPDSTPRRSAQTAIYHGFRNLVKLTAPVLSFTADEAWEYLPGERSVHLADWPDPPSDWENDPLAEDFVRLRKVREEVMRAIEESDEVDDTAEASLTISWPNQESLLREYEDQLPEWFICSEVSVVSGPDERIITVEHTEHEKCERCWRFRPSVQNRADVEGDDLCDRCHDVMVDRLSASVE